MRQWEVAYNTEKWLGVHRVYLSHFPVVTFHGDTGGEPVLWARCGHVADVRNIGRTAVGLSFK